MDESIKEIPVNSIVTGGLNPRKTFDPEHIRELTSSIRRDGQWDPIIVRRRSDRYELIAGECRLRAFKKLRLPTINARILSVDDGEAYLLALKTNLMRRNLNPIEEADGVAKLLERGWSQKEILQEIGKSRTWLYFRLKLSKNVSDGVKNAIIGKKIPLTHALKIVELPEGLQGLALEKALKDRLNFKEVEGLVNLLKNAKNRKDIERALKLPPDKLADTFKWVHRSSYVGADSEGEGVTVFECDCGVKYLIAWNNGRVVSREVSSHQCRSMDRSE